MLKRLLKIIIILTACTLLVALITPAIIGRWDASQLQQSKQFVKAIKTDWLTTSGQAVIAPYAPLFPSQLADKSALPVQIMIQHGPLISYNFKALHHWVIAKNLITLRSPAHWHGTVLLIQRWNGTFQGLIDVNNITWAAPNHRTHIGHITGKFAWVPHQSLLTNLTLQHTQQIFSNRLTLSIAEDNIQSTQHYLYQHWHGSHQQTLSGVTFSHHHHVLLHINAATLMHEVIHQAAHVHDRLLIHTNQLVFAGQHYKGGIALYALTTKDFDTLTQIQHCLRQQLIQLKSPLGLSQAWHRLPARCLATQSAKLHSNIILKTSDNTHLLMAFRFAHQRSQLTLHLPRAWLLAQLTDYYEAQATTSLEAAKQHAQQKTKRLLANPGWHPGPQDDNLTFKTAF